MEGAGRTDGRTILSVLVVDDDETVLSAAKRTLGGSWIVIAANNLTVARAQLAARTPDFIIVDQWLGNERGLEFLREVKRSHPSLVTALMSGRFSIDLAADATLAGVPVLAAKPRALRDIVHALAAASPTAAKPVCLESACSTPLDDAASVPSFADATRAFQRSFLEREMTRHGWNLSQAARELGVHRSWLHKLTRDLELYGPVA